MEYSQRARKAGWGPASKSRIVESWEQEDYSPHGGCNSIRKPPIDLPMRAIIEDFPKLAEPIIDGMQRRGETMNIIAAPKMGKSWFVYSKCLAIASGKPWLGEFPTLKGDVVLIDNELAPAVIASRVPRVAAAMGLTDNEWLDSFRVISLRGRRIDIFELGRTIDEYERGEVTLFVIDSKYRAQPKGSKENANEDETGFFNIVDEYAMQTDAAWDLVHHASKGNQNGKAATDIGAGGGAQSRAADCHLVLREHMTPGVVVVECALRSFRPMEPFCIQWEYPLWRYAPEHDPKLLKPERQPRPKPPKADKATPQASIWTAARFASEAVGAGQSIQAEVIQRGTDAGLTLRAAKQWLEVAEAQKLIYRTQEGRNKKAYFSTTKPAELPISSSE